MAPPQTTREALIAELLGDVDVLIGRAEELKTAIPDAAEKSAAQVTTAGNEAAKSIEQAGDKIRQKIESISKEAQEAAALVDGAARRFALLALAVGLCGGVIGGVLVGLALANGYFGV